VRIRSGRVLEILAAYKYREEIFREYPFLEEEDLHQGLGTRGAALDAEVYQLNQVA
jgi:uncharacterized protein (DUF433 family)